MIVVAVVAFGTIVLVLVQAVWLTVTAVSVDTKKGSCRSNSKTVSTGCRSDEAASIKGSNPVCSHGACRAGGWVCTRIFKPASQVQPETMAVCRGSRPAWTALALSGWCTRNSSTTSWAQLFFSITLSVSLLDSLAWICRRWLCIDPQTNSLWIGYMPLSSGRCSSRRKYRANHCSTRSGHSSHSSASCRGNDLDILLWGLLVIPDGIAWRDEDDARDREDDEDEVETVSLLASSRSSSSRSPSRAIRQA